MKSEILNVSNQLVAAAATGVYQGLIIAFLVALGVRFLVRTNAATRHAVWFCTMLLLAALVVAHCFSLRRVTADSAAPSAIGPVIPAVDTAVLSEPDANNEDTSGNLADVDTGSHESEHPLLTALIQAHPESTEDLAELEQTNGTEPGNAPADTQVASHSRGTDFRRVIGRLLNPISVELTVGSRFSIIAGVLLALWLMIASFRILILIVQLTRIRRLKHQSLPPGAELSELFQRLSARMVAKRKVELRVSPAHRSSFLLGFLHPVVLLPAAERMDAAEAELVLRHELAHVERRDDWVNLIQHFLLAVVFFHPAFWWISRQLSLEREIACDDHVLEQSQRPQAYALVLANLAARMQKRLPLLAPGSSNHKTQLKERIDMILNTHRNASPRLAKTPLALIASTVAIAAATVICSAPRLVLAQTETTVAHPPAPSAGVLPTGPTIEAAPVALVAGLPHPGPADHLPPVPALTTTVTAGAKLKVAAPAVTAPVVALTPATVSVVAAVPGQPPISLATIDPPSQPGAPRPPKPAKAARSENRDSSLEERLDRLERMVNSLMTQQNPKGRSDFQLKLEREGMIDRKEMARIEALAKQQADLGRISPQEIEKLKEQATREARQAVEQAKRATAEIEKARKVDHKEAVKKLKGDSQRQLEALRRQSEALERQQEKLDREIERLEQDQDNFEEQDDDSADIGSKPSDSREVRVTESHSQSHTHSTH